MKEGAEFNLPPKLENIKGWEKKNFYERLGVSYDSTQEEIKKAFRKLSVKYHPDKIHDDPSLRSNYEEVFKLISEAYTILSNKNLEFNNSIRSDSSERRNPRKHKKEFNEEREIRDFVKNTEELIKKSHFVGYEFEELCLDTKIEIDDLIKYGVDKEKLIQAIEKIILERFVTASHTSINNTNSFKHGCNEIKRNMAYVKNLGITKDLLSLIEKIVLSQFVDKSSYDIDNFLIEDSCDEIEENISYIKDLGIKKELLPLIEKKILERFIKETTSLLLQCPFKDVILDTKKSILKIEKLGISKMVLINSISDQKSKLGKMLVDYLK
ncbi:MAG: DnaJ domain-containing protein [Candidatus Paceibacterota bacterium]|jgi:hypothetical protein